MTIFIVIVASLLAIAFIGMIAALAYSLQTLRGFIKLGKRAIKLIEKPYRSAHSLYDTGERFVNESLATLSRIGNRVSSASESVMQSADKIKRQSAGISSSVGEMKKTWGSAGKYIDIALKIFKLAMQFKKMG